MTKEEIAHDWKYRRGFWMGTVVGCVTAIAAMVLGGVVDKLLSKPLGQLVDRILDSIL